jgi:hypothetical protein
LKKIKLLNIKNPQIISFREVLTPSTPQWVLRTIAKNANDVVSPMPITNDTTNDYSMTVLCHRRRCPLRSTGHSPERNYVLFGFSQRHSDIIVFCCFPPKSAIT